MSYFDPLPEVLTEETLNAIKENLARNINGTLPKTRTPRAPMEITDAAAECFAVFMYGVALPHYRIPVLWKSMELRPGGLTFNYQPGYGFATADSNELTRLAITAGERGCQVRIAPHSARAFKVSVFKWARWGGDWRSHNSTHPTLAEAVAGYHEGEVVPRHMFRPETGRIGRAIRDARRAFPRDNIDNFKVFLTNADRDAVRRESWPGQGPYVCGMIENLPDTYMGLEVVSLPERLPEPFFSFVMVEGRVEKFPIGPDLSRVAAATAFRGDA